MHDAVLGFERHLRIINQVYIRFVADVVLGGQPLHTKVFLACGIVLRHLHIGDGMIDAVVLASVAPHIEGEVERLAHLSVLEQGGIALSRHFRNLVLGGVNPQFVLARLGIGTYGDGASRLGDLGGVGMSRSEIYLI